MKSKPLFKVTLTKPIKNKRKIEAMIARHIEDEFLKTRTPDSVIEEVFRQLKYDPCEHMKEYKS